MAELKRDYVVPLRRKTKFAPKWRRSKKAMSVLKEFIVKHMKTDSVIICKELNEKIWENGIKNPPGKVSIVALKTQIAGSEKTLVNLSEFGVEKYLKNYDTQVVAPTPKAKKEKKASENTQEDVKDAEVKEVEAKKVEAKEDKKNKKEVKKDE